jgi:hypothetical protein
MAVRRAVADVFTGCAGSIPATEAYQLAVRIEEAASIIKGIAISDCSQTWTATARILCGQRICAGIVVVAFPVASGRICQAIPGTGTRGLHAFTLLVATML